MKGLKPTPLLDKKTKESCGCLIIQWIYPGSKYYNSQNKFQNLAKIVTRVPILTYSYIYVHNLYH